jgi:hypothetical protein
MIDLPEADWFEGGRDPLGVARVGSGVADVGTAGSHEPRLGRGGKIGVPTTDAKIET